MQIRLRTMALLTAGTFALGAPVPAFAVDPPTAFTFTGAGLGHGVGMSQIGAEGMALDGRSATEILQYFYTGTSVLPVPDATDLRVNLLHQVLTTKIRIEALPLSSVPLPAPTPTTSPTTSQTPTPTVITTPTPPVIEPAPATAPIARLSAADLPVGNGCRDFNRNWRHAYPLRCGSRRGCHDHWRRWYNDIERSNIYSPLERHSLSGRSRCPHKPRWEPRFSALSLRTNPY
jgi:hypothetical protein